MHITPMTPQDLALALAWAHQEGWNPGLADAACFHAADPTGFFIGRVAGEPVATISAVKYGSGFGFIGLYIVAPAWRGKGLGWQLWQHAMGTLHGRCVGLDGVLAQQDNYRKSGFRLAHRNIRFAGRTAGAAPLPAGVIPLTPQHLPAVLAQDAPTFPAERSAFLRRWLSGPASHHTLVYVENGAVVGHGSLRACHTGFKVGPLVAQQPAQAQALLNALCGLVPAQSEVFLDVPEPNTHAVALAQAQGMQPVFETARMYTGPAPELPLAHIFGITSFELG